MLDGVWPGEASVAGWGPLPPRAIADMGLIDLGARPQRLRCGHAVQEEGAYVKDRSPFLAIQRTELRH